MRGVFSHVPHHKSLSLLWNVKAPLSDALLNELDCVLVEFNWQVVAIRSIVLQDLKCFLGFFLGT